jgi:UDP-GlcNAc:undecaprenyl-phosphate GlcNAc-1-phosphate transferase
MTRFVVVHAVIYAALGGVAAAIAWAMARWRPLMDAPNDRSSHVRPTPRGGGVGIVVAALCGWVMFWSAGFGSRPAGAPEFGLAAGALVVALAGLMDDRRAQPASIKLGAQALAAGIAIGCGLAIERVALPGLGVVELGPLAWPLTFLWLVGLTNAFNFMDGLDGLAAATATIAAAALALVAQASGNGPVAALAWSLAAASAGFLLLNRPPARIFMGDVGSQFLGFAFAGLGVLMAARMDDGGGALLVPLLLFHFLFDTLLTAWRRWRRGAALWQAHREHLYQRLNRTGLSHGWVTLVVSAAALSAAALALAAADADGLWRGFGVAFALQLAYAAWVARREASR